MLKLFGEKTVKSFWGKRLKLLGRNSDIFLEKKVKAS